MHAFVATILLRMPRRDALKPNPEPHPADRQPGQPAESSRREGRTVVGTDGVWQAELSECGFKCRPNELRGRTLHPFTAQQESAERIRDRERVATLPVAHTEVPLEVRAPPVVRCLNVSERGPLVLHLSSPSFAFDQAAASKEIPDCAGGWKLCRRLTESQPVENFPRTPRRVPPSCVDQHLRY